MANKGAGAWRIDWRGLQAAAEIEGKLAKGLGEIGLRIEAAAKAELYPGHGKRTATLQRSIHTATPGYNWQGDNVPASASSPERGGQETQPEKVGETLALEIGSGMQYAMAVHQGHHNFGGYQYLTKAVEKVKPLVPDILNKHMKGG